MHFLGPTLARRYHAGGGIGGGGGGGGGLGLRAEATAMMTATTAATTINSARRSRTFGTSTLVTRRSYAALTRTRSSLRLGGHRTSQQSFGRSIQLRWRLCCGTESSGKDRVRYLVSDVYTTRQHPPMYLERPATSGKASVGREPKHMVAVNGC